ncbi:kinase-like protein [Periconia macrospinosa]|uniref:Kinase-like protein n=1 Tax=Periconia macrospinosa TaxID=97972 RepID=A0A2V1EC12_9PLEO|nr:kinase-like protein [Periconia macrospinosa]
MMSEEEELRNATRVFVWGVRLLKLERWSEAEVQFRRALNVRERILGGNHGDTILCKSKLASALFNQQKCSEAEEQYQQVVQAQERVLSKDHEQTLYSKHMLGRTLFAQKKYSEAQLQFQQAADWRERVLGKDYEETLRSKHMLGRTLYEQEKYSEAVVQLQQAADGEEETLGRGDRDTLVSKHWLGCALYQQKKYSEATVQLQQAVNGWEKLLGRDHEITLMSKYWLGCALYTQNKYSEAIVQLQQAADGREKLLSRDHKDTLASKHWLGLALYKQKKYNEAIVQLQQAADGREKLLGRDHEDTRSALDLLDEMKAELYKTSSASSADATWHNPASRLEDFFPKEQYTDSDINGISSLLGLINPQWGNVPRTYIVLRVIGHLNILQDIIDVGFSDFWFPVTEQSLPGILSPSARSAFVNAQWIVLTKSMDLERGENGKHCHFKEGEPLPFEPKGIIGRGACGQVDKVLSTISFREYARKIVHRSEVFRGAQKEQVKRFIAEIQVLKRLKHHHIVEFVGSYTDAKYIGLIMSPVAEMDLSAYLARCNVSNYPELRTFFGCLATALEFLHLQKVRHKDIKPGNILVHHDKVLFADFGLSFDFTDANGSTTTGMTWKTPRYCAPEVAEYDPRNTSSDVWSLGVVYMEMAAVLKGKTIPDMDDFLREHGSQQTHIRANMAGLLELVAMLEGTGQPSDNIVFSWTRKMLVIEQRLRPTASSLVELIVESENPAFCGICCKSPEEEMSDWTVE